MLEDACPIEDEEYGNKWGQRGDEDIPHGGYMGAYKSQLDTLKINLYLLRLCGGQVNLGKFIGIGS